MRLRVVWLIFKKEWLETLRDRQTLSTVLFLPLILYPVLFLGAIQLTLSSLSENKGHTPRVAVWGSLPAPYLVRLTSDAGVAVVEVRSAVADAGEEALRERLSQGDVDVVLSTSLDAADKQQREERFEVAAWFNGVNVRSKMAHTRVAGLLSDAAKDDTAQRLARRDLPKDFDRPMRLDKKDVSTGQQRAGDLGAMALPLLLVLMVVFGGFSAAADTTAGEKERGTLQTLLCAPVHPVELVAGKLLNVALISAASGAINLASMGLTFGRQAAAMADAGLGAMEFHLSLPAIAVVLAGLVPLAILGAALMMWVANFAKTAREASVWLSPFIFVFTAPAAITLSPDAVLSLRNAWWPVANVALLMRAMIRGDAPGLSAFVVILSSLGWAAWATFACARAFDSDVTLYTAPSRKAAALPTARQSIAFAGLLLALSVFSSSVVDPKRLGALGAVAVVQLGFLLLPALMWIRLFRHDAAKVFSWKVPSRRASFGIALLASGTWAVGRSVHALLVWWVPAHVEAFEKILAGALGPLDHVPLPLSLLVVALLPAVCEEACFRGVVLAGLSQGHSRAFAIVGSATSFGLMHGVPVHVAITTSMGLVLAYATLETGSLAAGVAVHFAINGLAVVGSQFPDIGSVLQSAPAVVIGLAMTAFGMVLVRRRV